MMRKNTLVYISGPISPKNGNTIEENIAAGLKVFIDLTKLGIPSYLPHMTATFPSAHHIDYKTWMDYDFAIIDRCTHMLMLPTWKDSKGAVEEKQYAEMRIIPVVGSIQELLELLGD
jgi:hypothetical protein